MPPHYLYTIPFYNEFVYSPTQLFFVAMVMDGFEVCKQNVLFCEAIEVLALSLCDYLIDLQLIYNSGVSL